MNKLKRGDEVFVASGKDKGRRGVIVEILDKQKVLVEGINIVKPSADFAKLLDAVPTTTAKVRNKYAKIRFIKLCNPTATSSSCK